MKITLEKSAELTRIIAIEIKKDNYIPLVDKELRELRKKINLPGFRKGNIPMSIMKQRFGKSVLVDEVLKLLPEKLTNYITDNNLKLLGEPLASKSKENIANWQNPSDFIFYFDIAIMPEPEIELTKDITIQYYNIILNNKIIEDYINNYQQKYGKYVEVDFVDENHLIYGDFNEVNDDGNPIENGLSVKDVSLIPKYIQDEKVKTDFLKLSKGKSIIFNPKQAIKNETELKHLFKIELAEINKLDTNFSFKVSKITNFVKADFSPELFEKVYGKGIVKDEKEFKEKIKSEVADNLIFESEYKFKEDFKETLLEKFTVKLPDEFLKRWLVETAKDKEQITDEVLNKEYPVFAKNLKWSIIIDSIVKNFNIEISEEEINDKAKEYMRQQLYRYGFYQITDEQLELYSKEILKNKNEINKIIEGIKEEKVIGKSRKLITLKNKKISLDNFNKLL